MKKLGSVGLIGRFRPLHLGAATMLESICEQAEHVTIGIGSVNKYNLRNPFTPDEVEDMIHLLLKDRFTNYKVVRIEDSAHIPEYSDGQKWVTEIRDTYGPLDKFLTGNPYVTELLDPHYETAHPVIYVPEEKRIRLSGTVVRTAMAQGEAWKKMVPEPIAQYMAKNGLVDRFRAEFGLEALSKMLDPDLYRRDLEYEKQQPAKT